MRSGVKGREYGEDREQWGGVEGRRRQWNGKKGCTIAYYWTHTLTIRLTEIHKRRTLEVKGSPRFAILIHFFKTLIKGLICIYINIVINFF